MKLLITGMAGFIGSDLVETFLQQGNEMSGSDNLSQHCEFNMGACLTIVRGERPITVRRQDGLNALEIVPAFNRSVSEHKNIQLGAKTL